MSALPDLSAIARMPLRERLAQVEQLIDYQRFNRALFFKPYPKQREFFALGRDKSERMMSAGNQFGKTLGGAYEMGLHLTGMYPQDWPGRRWRRPIRAWCAGESAVKARDDLQEKLCGPSWISPADLGTGFIPLHCLDRNRIVLSKGVSGAYDMVSVKHFTEGQMDGWSWVQFKSYEQGRTKFQGATLDLLWLDEEPDEDIYAECLARTTATAGMVYVTFTPLKGATNVTSRFFGTEDGAPIPQNRALVTMAVDDCPHMTPEVVARKKDEYPQHQWRARLYGEPMLGEGAVFPIMEEGLVFDLPAGYAIPQHWVKLWGIDFGIGHPFAAVLMAWDKDADVRYIVAEIKLADAVPVQHAALIRSVAANVPVAWPHDGDNRDKGSGRELAKQYSEPWLPDGLNMLKRRAEFVDGSISTEAGVQRMLALMKAGKLKVSRSCVQWLAEFRRYHRKDGLIVKTYDDLMSATRVAIMAERFARAVPLGARSNRRRGASTTYDPEAGFWEAYHGG